MALAEARRRMYDRYLIPDDKILFASQDQIESAGCSDGRVTYLGVCGLNGAGVVVIISRAGAIIGHIAHAGKFWNPSRSWPEESVWDPNMGMGTKMGMGTGMKGLNDLFLTHQHNWYRKDQGVNAVVVSAASDTEEGDNTTQSIEDATELVRSQLVEWQIPVREATYRARDSNDPLGPANAMILVKISHEAQGVWLNDEVVVSPSPR